MIAARGLDMGTTQRMGPGMFLSSLHRADAARHRDCGAIVLHAEEAIGKVPWRGLVLILAAPVLFGITIRGSASSARWCWRS